MNGLGKGLAGIFGNLSSTGRKAALGGLVGSVALGVGASEIAKRRKKKLEEYDRGDVWPNQDEACARKEAKAFHNPKMFMGV